jgi:ferric-dicitrate binding protein FerR (iron transport regulator)
MKDKHIQLIIKKLTSQANNTELNEINEWINKSDENKKEYDSLVEAWKNSDSYKADYKGNKSLAWKNIDSATEKQVKVISIRTRLLRIAAAVIFIAASGVALHFITQSNSTITFSNYNLTAKEISLPDGTTVWLKKGAELSYIDNTTTREVTFSGEGYFDVFKNANKPFIIKDKKIKTTVLGTSFNLISADSTSLSLVEGKVSFEEITNPTNKVIITPGNSVSFNNNKIKTYTTSNQNFNSWKTGVLTFKNNNLEYVSNVLENYYNTTIKLSNESTNNCLFTGEFKNESLTNILDVMSFTYDMKYTENNNSYKLTILNCK